MSRDPMLCSGPQAAQTQGQWFTWAAALRCVRHSSTSVSAPVGLSGRQPGNYTALTTSPERKAHYHTHTHAHTDKHLFAFTEYTDHTTPPAHTRYLSLILSLPPQVHTHSQTHIHRPSQTQGLHYVKEDYNDSNLTQLCSRSAAGVSVPEFTVSR